MVKTTKSGTAEGSGPWPSQRIVCNGCGQVTDKSIAKLVANPQFTCRCGTVYDFSDQHTQAGFRRILELTQSHTARPRASR